MKKDNILWKNIVIFFIILYFFGISIHYLYADCCTPGHIGTEGDCPPCLPNPLGDNNTTNINVLIGKVINAVLGIVGSLALVMFIYGGLTWMTAAGNKEKIQKGKDILIWATIGLIIIFSAYAIVKFVLVDVLQGASSGDQTQQTTGG